MTGTDQSPTWQEWLVAQPRQRTGLLPALLKTQELAGFVSDEAMRDIALRLRVTVNEIEGVATAYPELRRSATARRVVRSCDGLSCQCRGQDAVLKTLESALGVKLHATSSSGVALEPMPCGFLCAVGPVVEVDGIAHGRVDSADVARLIAPLLEGEQ